MIIGITPVILNNMKTAISVRDNVYKRGEKYAKKQRMSRSQLYSDALEEYLDKRDVENLKDNLERVYSKEDSSVDPVLFKMALLSLPKEEW